MANDTESVIVVEDSVPTEIPATVSQAPKQSPIRVPLISAKPGLTSISDAVRAGAGSRIPKGIEIGNTADIELPWWHICIYGETDAWKTTTAAQFGTPENVRVIGTRRKEQLLPLKKLGYQYAIVHDSSELEFALLHPEALWPGFLELDNPILILDDVTSAKEMWLEANETRTVMKNGVEQEVERKDPRAMYREATQDVRALFKVVLNRPFHFVMVALASIYTNPISHEESISPDLPPQMRNLLMTDFEYCFFIDKKKHLLLTTSRVETFKAKNAESGRNEEHIRTIYAKRKLPKELEKANVLQTFEQPDLQALTQKLRAAIVGGGAGVSVTKKAATVAAKPVTARSAPAAPATQQAKPSAPSASAAMRAKLQAAKKTAATK